MDGVQASMDRQAGSNQYSVIHEIAGESLFLRVRGSPRTLKKRVLFNSREVLNLFHEHRQNLILENCQHDQDNEKGPGQQANAAQLALGGTVVGIEFSRPVGLCRSRAGCLTGHLAG